MVTISLFIAIGVLPLWHLSLLLMCICYLYLSVKDVVVAWRRRVEKSQIFIVRKMIPSAIW